MGNAETKKLVRNPHILMFKKVEKNKEVLFILQVCEHVLVRKK